jgi:subtilisin family serine protease
MAHALKAGPVNYMFCLCMALQVFFFFFIGPLPSDAFGNEQKNYVPGEVIIKYHTGAAERKSFIEGRPGWRVLKNFRDSRLNLIKISSNENVREIVLELQNDPDVAYVEPNYYIYPAGMPDDPDMGLVWALNNTGQEINGTAGTEDADIDAPEAWDIETGSRDIVIAVIDSGIDYSHPDLAANIWQNAGEIAGNGIDDDGNGFIDDLQGWDFVDDNNDPMDFLGHGTNNAGIIGAVGNNATGLAGVLWSARLMNLKMMDSLGVGTTAQAVAAIEYASENGAHIINASWADSEYSQALKDAISGFDGLFITAAGNSGSDNDATQLYPASYDLDNVVSVAGSDASDELAFFSNYGAQSVDLAAPAMNNYTTLMNRETVFFEDFEDGDISGWTSGGSPDSWGIESSQPINGGFSVAESPGQNYVPDSDNWITAPAIDAEGKKGLQLTFRLSGSSEYDHDFLTLQASRDLAAWEAVDFYVPGVGYLPSVSGGTSNLRVYADLSGFDGAQSLYFRFCFTSDAEDERSGWIIDDVSITAVSGLYDGSEYGYAGGTSAATAYTSGVAGLMLCVKPEACAADLKSAVLSSVDKLEGLEGMVLSGGRLNAFEAVKKLEAGGGSSLPFLYLLLFE